MPKDKIHFELTELLTCVSSASRTLPEEGSRKQKYATVYQGVEVPGFWRPAAQYVELTSPVAAAITALNVDSSCLSGAVFYVYTTSISSVVDACNQFFKKMLL